MREDLHTRLIKRMSTDPDSGCWLWTGVLNVDGYGQFKVAGKTRRVHRLMFEIVKGPVPNGLYLDHLCRVRHCINPDHLEAVTMAENIRRGVVGINWSKRSACSHDHPYTPENTYLRPTPGSPDRFKRVCRTCHREQNRQSYWRMKRVTA